MESIRSREDILTCEITPANRLELEEGLAFAAKHRHMIAALPSIAQHAIVELGTDYLRDDEHVYFRKLFANAVPYLAQGRISREAGGFLVQGNTRIHHVTATENEGMICDCDLFNGRDEFDGKEGECSHLQTVTLLRLAEANLEEPNRPLRVKA